MHCMNAPWLTRQHCSQSAEHSPRRYNTLTLDHPSVLAQGLTSGLQDLRVGLVDALEATNTTSREVWKSFWSAQQRFFKLLCISMKVRSTEEWELRRALPPTQAVISSTPKHANGACTCTLGHNSAHATR